MSWTYSDEYYKNYTRDTWNEAAAAYEAGFGAQMASIGHALLADLAVTPHDAVLDLATGPGEPALTIAAMLADHPGATGSVTGVDLSIRMIELAIQRAAERGLSRVRFQVEDAEHLSCADARVSRRCSHASDSKSSPTRSKPRARSCAYCDPAGELAAVLLAAGCIETRERLIPSAFAAPSVDAYWEMAIRGTPIGHSLAEEPLEAQRTIEAAARANIAADAAADGTVTIPTTAMIVTARKPG